MKMKSLLELASFGVKTVIFKKKDPKIFRVRVRFNISVIITRRKTASEQFQDAVF